MSQLTQAQEAHAELQSAYIRASMLRVNVIAEHKPRHRRSRSEGALLVRSALALHATLANYEAKTLESGDVSELHGLLSEAFAVIEAQLVTLATPAASVSS